MKKGRPFEPTLTQQYKGTDKFTEKKELYRFFSNNHSTMYDAAVVTGITRPNITRRVRELEDSGLIERTHQGVCPISDYAPVWFFRKKGGCDGRD